LWTRVQFSPSPFQAKSGEINSPLLLFLSQVLIVKQKRTKQQAIIRVLAITFVLNLGIALAKLGYGYYTQTLSMIADGFHSLMDGTSNLVGFVAISYAFDPPDEAHPYGHRKAEIVASLFIAVLLGLTCVEILKEVVTRLFSPATPEVTMISFIIMGLGILINLGVVRYESRAGKELNSPLLISDSMHTRSDILVSISVLLSLLAIKLQWYFLDTLISLAITGVIGKMAFEIFQENLGILLDKIPLNKKEIEEIVENTEGVFHCHQIRAHGAPEALYLELHIWVAPEQTVTKAHELSHLVKDRLKSAIEGLEDVTIHIEPAELPKKAVPHNHVEH
jgi:cation diffusion facilitator family transporter